MPDLVHVIDRNFRIMFFNKTFKEKHKRLGLDIKVIGKTPFDSYLFLPDKIREEYMTVFKTGEMLITEEPTKINRKEIVTETRKIPIHEGERVSLVVTVIRNITAPTKLEEEMQGGEEKLKRVKEETRIKIQKERSKIAKALKKKIAESKKAYSELQRSKDELIRTERLAFTGRIAAGIAHEIRNPLTNIAMSVKQFIRTINPEKSGSKHVDIITRNTERINFLITELLNCARPPKLDIQPFNIHMVLKNVLDAARPKISLKRIKVTKRFATSKLPIVEIDREQIERAFLNIVINAVEAMSNKGKLIIFTKHNKERLIIKFHDNGKGIPEEDIIRIFDPFFSSKKDGVGLGLSVCYGIIVSHGGTIEVESKWKKGSDFTISLPIRQNSTHRGG